MTSTFKEIFYEKEISPSYTRTRIYSYLEETKSHSTADEIYKALIDELPTLSKTTVYNVLNLFISKELVKAVNMNSVETRYELKMQKHSHFRCTVCGEITDIPTVETKYNKEELNGFKILDEEVNIIGVCSKCN